MQVLSPGVPMTCGEIYALVRRRRDERSAACRPPFGLQLSQADVQGCASSRYSVTRTAASAAAASTTASAASTSVEAAMLAMLGDGGNSMTARLAQSGNVHLLVLLSEVQLLQYLRSHAHLSAAADADVSYVYGPSSAYTTSASGDDDDDNADAQQQQQQQQHVVQLQRAVRTTMPGSVAHVRAVRTLLCAYETRGRAQEQRSIAALRTLLAAAAAGVPTPRHNGYSTSATTTAATVKHEPVDDAPLVSLQQQQQQPPSRRALRSNKNNDDNNDKDGDNSSVPRRLRPLLAPPTSLPGSISNNTSSSTLRSQCILSDMELLRLVDARPRCSLDVHRVIDELDERLGGDEEAVAHVVDDIVNVFASAAAAATVAQANDDDDNNACQ